MTKIILYVLCLKRQKLEKEATCTFLNYVHLVFVTKYRKAIFTKDHLKTMELVFKKICKDSGAELTEFDGETGLFIC